jgi:hypothetical protein
MYRRNRSQCGSRLPASAASQEPFDPGDPWLWLGAEGARVLAWPGQPGHGCTAVLRSRPAMVAGGQRAGGPAGASGLTCCERGGDPYLDCPRAFSHLPKIRGRHAIAGRLAAHERRLGRSSHASGNAFRRKPGGRLRDCRDTRP